MVRRRGVNTTQTDRVALRDDNLPFTPPTSPVLEATNSAGPAMRSEPSIIILTTPPRSSSTAKSISRTRRPPGLRASPSLEIVDEKSSQPPENRRKTLRASPSLVIEDGPPPISSQRRAKKAHLAAPSGSSTPSASQYQLPVQNESFSCSSSQPPPSSLPSLIGSGSSAIAGLSFLATLPVPALSQPTPTPSKGKRKQKLQGEGEGRGEQYLAPSQPPSSSLPSLMSSGSSAIADLSSLTTPPVTQVPALSQPTPTSSKGKRKRESQDEGKGREEKRLARYKSKCPQNILDRVERVWKQRLFMIDRSRSGDEPRETFSVLGSTGNVYTVVIDQMPRCNCPDALKGNHCKHILFIFFKVLRVPNESPHWYQKALLSSELEEIFSQAPLAPNCVAHAHVLDAHARATAPFSGPSSQSTKKRWPTKDDDCPICYETMFGVAENGLKFCDACGNAIHEECWKQWQASNLRSGKSVTCVWCRAEMNMGGVGKGRKAKGTRTNSDEGYLNLASVAGLSPVRDTSTYHRWGRGYGRDYFDDDY